MYGGIDEYPYSGEDIDLTPDMSRVWGKVIKGLREKGENVLHAVCADLNTVDYTRDTVEITCKDDAVYELLVKHKKKLEEFSGAGVINIHKKKESVKGNMEVIAGLTELFGDKLTIKRR